jgi:NADH-quinone oxidoreductase subunit E
MFTLHEEECLGACDAAPVVTVNFANFDGVTPDGVDRLIATLRDGGSPAPARGDFPGDFKAASRILAGIGGGPASSSSERESASGSPPGET